VAAEVTATPEAVWLTAESLGLREPALAAWPDTPAVFVFDEPLLARLRLSAKRLVFLTETLAELAEHRPLRIVLGDPVHELAGTRLAVTFAPVPGFQRRAAQLDVVAMHPYPWWRRPSGGDVRSHSAWIRNGSKHRAP
jgi:deoxyribodipyrimidine photo-lyase